MSTAPTDIDALYDDATAVAVPAVPSTPDGPASAQFSRVSAATAALDSLLNTALPSLHKAAVALEQRRLTASRVDGRIIGTGEADFTKGNTVYTLNHKGKTFQLLDVPGIEGDESRYARMVEEAVAKAHLVVYVNGTNKKPEKATAEKIRAYLHWGTRVYPIFNVRGSADAYEFDQDRVQLASPGSGARLALSQTVGVLGDVLPDGVLLPGSCVQGLLGFASLSVDSGNGRTTIHPSRDKDLVVQQRNYRKTFASWKAMFEFSQLGEVAKVIDSKLLTFREDIIESNKVKVRQLLTESIVKLHNALAEHQRFMEGMAPSFKDCRNLIESSLTTFERIVDHGLENRWSQFFSDLSERADAIVAQHYGENDTIESKLKIASADLQTDAGKAIQMHVRTSIDELHARASEALERLAVDIQRLQFLQAVKLDSNGGAASFSVHDLDMSLSLKEWSGIAFNIGSYALSGAGIGSVFPVIGTAIGAIVGAAVGVLVSAVGFFTSKEKRIRKAQAQVQEKIAEARRDVMCKLPDESAKIATSVRAGMASSVLAQIDALHDTLARPLAVIEKQIAAMTHIQTQLEKMPHGTIQAIQR
ncbi:hypothetical protein [Burkholderia gladioli]|uniref:hypothetical protein n=1 Tax=Burkholderia gladioli TaxID=28095 RepID=UPI0038B23199